MNEVKVYKTDWLASTPVFYNEKTGAVSENVNEVIDYNNIELHPEGFNNYLDCGFSVLEQTPIKNVKFLRHSSVLTKTGDNLKVERLADPVEKLLDATSNEHEVMAELKKAINNWESEVMGEIIIPTSGGYDSRLLNCLINDKSRIRSFTYGTSENQSLSFEVMNAKKLSKKLGTRWEQIQLGDFLDYLDEWDSLFGPAVHAHGMYQMEFYKKILPKVNHPANLLSGIIGDAWAGSVNLKRVDSADKVKLLAYAHGMHADSKYSLLKSGNHLLNEYFLENEQKLKNQKYAVVEAMRFKTTLLSYLIKVPKQYGFNVWSPFLDVKLAASMLNIKAERRQNRLWQEDFFKLNDLNFERDVLIKDRSNALDLQALRRRKLQPLDGAVLGEVINVDYLVWINKTLANASRSLTLKKYLSWPFSVFYFLPKLHVMPHKIKADWYSLNSQEIKAFNAYLTLKPIENILKRRR